jgi:hypothetical protein
VRDAKAALVDAADATLTDHAMNRRELIASVAEVARAEEQQLRRMMAAESPRQLTAAAAVTTSTSAAAALRGRWARRHSDWGSCRTMSLPPLSKHERTLVALARDAESIAAFAPVRALVICPDAAPSRVSPYGHPNIDMAVDREHARCDCHEDDAPSAAPDDDAVDAPSETDDRRLHEPRRALEDYAPSAASGDDVEDAPSEIDDRWLHEPRRALEGDAPPSAAPGNDVDDVPSETDDRGLLEPRRALEKGRGLATEDDCPPRVQSGDKEASSPNTIVASVALADAVRKLRGEYYARQFPDSKLNPPSLPPPSTDALDNVRRSLFATMARARRSRERCFAAAAADAEATAKAEAEAAALRKLRGDYARQFPDSKSNPFSEPEPEVHGFEFFVPKGGFGVGSAHKLATNKAFDESGDSSDGDDDMAVGGADMSLGGRGGRGGEHGDGAAGADLLVESKPRRREEATTANPGFVAPLWGGRPRHSSPRLIMTCHVRIWSLNH